MSIRPRALAMSIALLAPIASAPPAFGWGADGHRITGEIAWRNLAPRTKDAVRALMPDRDYGTLAATTFWADAYARRFPERYRWLDPLHYMNAAPDAERVTAGRDCGCVVGAIEIQIDRLRDPRADHAAKVEALRLVAHFVGDVHQPLHVAHPDGRGGTRTRVVFGGREMTLHELWDDGFLRRRLRERPRSGRVPKWRAYAQSLDAATPAADRAAWRASSVPRDWATESLALAKRATHAVRDGAVVGDDAYRAAIPEIERRLVQAGVRLAALLDASFDAPSGRAPSGPVD